MAKAYGIIRDDCFVLVGRGGRSGKRRAVRDGLHLPGGTCDPSESAINSAVREIREETGILLLESDNVASFERTLDNTQITFVVFEVTNLEELIAGRTLPKITNAFDEPFEYLDTLAISNCWTNAGFSVQYRTDWFRIGLQQAFTRQPAM